MAAGKKAPSTNLQAPMKLHISSFNIQGPGVLKIYENNLSNSLWEPTRCQPSQIVFKTQRWLKIELGGSDVPSGRRDLAAANPALGAGLISGVPPGRGGGREAVGDWKFQKGQKNVRFSKRIDGKIGGLCERWLTKSGGGPPHSRTLARGPGKCPHYLHCVSMQYYASRLGSSFLHIVAHLQN